MRHHTALLIMSLASPAAAATPAAAQAPAGAGTTTAPAHVPWMLIAPAPPMGWNSWNKFGCTSANR